MLTFKCTTHKMSCFKKEIGGYVRRAVTLKEFCNCAYLYKLYAGVTWRWVALCLCIPSLCRDKVHWVTKQRRKLHTGTWLLDTAYQLIQQIVKDNDALQWITNDLRVQNLDLLFFLFMQCLAAYLNELDTPHPNTCIYSHLACFYNWATTCGDSSALSFNC